MCLQCCMDTGCSEGHCYTDTINTPATEIRYLGTHFSHFMEEDDADEGRNITARFHGVY